MDGTGADGKGPCTTDRVKCTESIRFYDFSVVGPGGPESLLGESAKRTTTVTSTSTSTSGGHQHMTNGSSSRCAKSIEDCGAVACCRDPGMQCYEQNRYRSGCRKSCTPDLSADGWTCKRLGPRTPQAGWDTNRPLSSMASTTTSSQGGSVKGTSSTAGTAGTVGRTIPRKRGETSEATGAVVSDRGSYSGSSDTLKWLAIAALVALPSLAAAACFIHRSRHGSKRDFVMAMPSHRPRPGKAFPGDGLQRDLPLVRVPPVCHTWDSHSTLHSAATLEEEEPVSTWQRMQVLLSGCSLSVCSVGCARSRHDESMQRPSRPRAATTMTLMR